MTTSLILAARSPSERTAYITKQGEDNTMFSPISNRVLTRVEELDLIRRSQAGDREATQTLVHRNTRLICRMARRWTSGFITYEDAFQEASLGLLAAIERFDTESGYKLSTTAVMWMRQHLNRAVETSGHVVRLPSHVAQAVKSVRSAERLLQRKLGRDPEDQEVAEHLEITLARLNQLRGWALQPLSLDAVWGDREEDENIGKFIRDDAAFQVMDMMPEHLQRLAAINELLAFVKRKEADVLRRRFGVHPYERSYSLQEIADVYGKSREHIRQVEVRAKSKCLDAATELGIKIEDLL